MCLNGIYWTWKCSPPKQQVQHLEADKTAFFEVPLAKSLAQSWHSEKS